MSRWWVDLSNELDHYIEYGIWLEEETLRWRNTKIDCYFEEGIGGCTFSDCYDKYVVSSGAQELVCDSLLCTNDERDTLIPPPPRP